MRGIIGLVALGIATSCATQKGEPPQSEVDRLATRVRAAAGGDRLAEVAQIDFTFVVYDGEKRIFEAKHRWDLRGARDRATWTDREGVARDVVVDLKTRSDEKAYARWVNDSYWLMLPLKLLDPGVVRTLEAPRVIEGRRCEVMRLSFDRVGLTPGDVYWLFIDPATDRIVRWEMVLEGQAPPPKVTSFEDYRAIGPLLLAHDHKNDDGQKRIVFEDTRALTDVDESAFDQRGARSISK
jgi:hypothetical protein